MELRNTTRTDIENGIGPNATCAYLCKETLKAEAQNTGKNLDHLIAQIPVIDINKTRKRTNDVIRDIEEETK